MSEEYGRRTASIQTPERPARKMVYDFDKVKGTKGLAVILASINLNGFDLITVTQDGFDYTVFFRRPAP